MAIKSAFFGVHISLLDFPYFPVTKIHHFGGALADLPKSKREHHLNDDMHGHPRI